MIRNFVFGLLLLAVAGGWMEHYRLMLREEERLKSNLEAMGDSICYYRSSLDEQVASVAALRLRCGEVERLREEDLRTIHSLGLRLKRTEALARQVAQTRIEVEVPLYDTVILRDTVRLLRWCDQWVRVEGELYADSLSCRVESVDTLVQIVHRVPRRFLFFRWGTKAIRQEIISKNPHTHIVYSEYLKLER